MLPFSATVDAVRLLRRWAHRADAHLARSAAHNAAQSMHGARVRELEDARTMRDLEKIPAAEADRLAAAPQRASARR
jgi:hypothetical protein